MCTQSLLQQSARKFIEIEGLIANLSSCFCVLVLKSGVAATAAAAAVVVVVGREKLLIRQFLVDWRAITRQYVTSTW